MDFGLPKKERIYLKDDIQSLFKKGDWLHQHPIRMVYLQFEEANQDSIIKMGVSVPKKRFKKAVDRNKIKRLIKESYRVNKNEIWESVTSKNKSCLLMFVFSGNEVLPYTTIEKKIILLLQELEAKL